MGVAAADAVQKFSSLPLLSHHHMLQRRNLHTMFPTPGVTNKNIPIKRKIEEDLDHELDTLEVGGLYQGYGTHYVDLWIGYPTPQRQTVIVDTGSGITAFPCSGCTDCGHDYHASEFFIESQSESFEKMNCDNCVAATCRNRGSGDNEYCYLSVSYQEGSMWSAYEAKDRTYLGGPHDGSLKMKEEGSKLGGQIHGEDPMQAALFEFDMVFGCQTKITGLFKTQLADGIAGMCLKSSALFQQMYDKQVINNPSFSLCFVRGEEAAKDGTTAGALTMGGTDTKLHASPMLFAKGFATKGVMHGVAIRAIYIMEAGQYRSANATTDNTKTVAIQQSSLNSGSIIVDSGTTDTYFTRNLASPFKELFKQITGFSYNENGMSLSDEQVDKLPTILVQLEGTGNNANHPGSAGAIDPENPNDILLAIPPAHYIEYDSQRKQYVGRFSMTEARGSVIGANTMRGHDVFFDIKKTGKIGFAESDCDYKELIGVNLPETIDPKTDDYYDEKESKLENDPDQPVTAGFKDGFTCDDMCKNGVIGAGILVAVVTLFSVYKGIMKRRRYQLAMSENEHLNDLVLDTEIQLAEIS